MIMRPMHRDWQSKKRVLVQDSPEKYRTILQNAVQEKILSFIITIGSAYIYKNLIKNNGFD